MGHKRRERNTILRIPTERDISSVSNKSLKIWIILLELALSFDFGKMVEVRDLLITIRRKLVKSLAARRKHCLIT
jgi:hypothetical protein